MNFTYFKPFTTIDKINDTLDKYGVAVLPNVFSPEESDYAKQRVYDYLAKTYNVIEPNDYEKLNPLGNGILHYFGLSLIKEILDLKTDKRVVDIFKKIWNNEDVTMSFDGINILPPPEQTIQKKLKTGVGFHSDQSSFKKGKCCVQGFINLEDTDEGDGCLSVLKYSHNYLEAFYSHFNIQNQRDWFILNKNHLDWYIQNGCEWNKILAPKGSMVFWDSRTIHAGTAPEEHRKNTNRWRFVIYTCYTPRRFQSKEDAVKKREAYIDNRMTSHWPYGVNVFKKSVNDTKTNNLDDLTDWQKNCIGI